MQRAQRGYIEDVIEPSTTRRRICEDLDFLENKELYHGLSPSDLASPASTESMLVSPQRSSTTPPDGWPRCRSTLDLLHK